MNRRTAKAVAVLRSPSPVVALVCVALTFASFGCGGGGGEATSGASPGPWSADICNAVADFQQDVQTRGARMQLGTVTSIAEARRQLVGYLDWSIRDADKMLDELEAAGNPAVENGDKIGQTLRTELGAIEPALQEARKKMAALPDNPHAFASGAEEIGTELNATISEVGGRLDVTLGQFDTPELGRAMQDVPACRELGVIG